MKEAALTLLLAGSLLIGTGSVAQAEQSPVSTDVYFVPVAFLFDNTQLTPPEGQRVFIYEGSTYVPLRFIACALNKSVEWEGSSYTVSLSEPSPAEKVTIDEYKLNRIGKSGQTGLTNPAQIVPTNIKAYFEKITYVFDGKEVRPPQQLPGFIYQDVLYVPLRFVSESLGKDIGWNQETYTVSVSTKPADTNEKAKQEPAAAPAAPVNTSTGGGGGGGAILPSKPSYESLVGDTDTKVKNLQASAQSSFTNLLNQYRAATNDTQKALLISQGWTSLSDYNAKFDAIINDLRSTLSANGYSTDVIKTYQEQYEKAKADALSGLK